MGSIRLGLWEVYGSKFECNFCRPCTLIDRNYKQPTTMDNREDEDHNWHYIAISKAL